MKAESEPWWPGGSTAWPSWPMLVAAKEPWWQQVAEKVKAQTDGANSRKSPPPVRGHFCAAKCPIDQLHSTYSNIFPTLHLCYGLQDSAFSIPPFARAFRIPDESFKRQEFLSYLQIEIVLQRYFFAVVSWSSGDGKS